MAELSELIKQPQFSSAAEKAMLNVMATNNWIVRKISDLMGEHDLTMPQYNVLRILRGSHPESLTCGEIAERLLDRTPDVTRLLDRLESAQLVDRRRHEEDRRMMMVSITDRGLDRLGGMDEEVDALIERLTRHLDEEEEEMLSRLLEKMRADQTIER